MGLKLSDRHDYPNEYLKGDNAMNEYLNDEKPNGCLLLLCIGIAILFALIIYSIIC